MLFSRKRVGVDLSRHGVKMVLLDGSSSDCQLSAMQERTFAPGAFVFTRHDLLTDSDGAVIAQIRDAYNCLNTRLKRTVVTLPDSVGKILVLDIDERFKSRTEGLELIRWKLKKRFAVDLNDMQLDYQILEEKESGELSVLVVLVSRVVIKRCEALLCEAGLEPVRIEFNCMSLHRPFAVQLDSGGASGLICFHGGTLGIMIMQDGVPQFIRSKELSDCSVTDPRVFMELKRTFISWRERHQNRGIDTIHTLAPPNSADRFDAMITEATGIIPKPFTIADVVPSRDVAASDRATLYPFAAAIGAAWRTV